MPLELPYIISGIVFGLSGGLTPGPLLTLVISETLRHNTKEGIKVAIVPLITDLPIVVTSVYLFSYFSNLQILIGIIAMGGALFLIYLGYESITYRGIELDIEQLKPQSIKKGILANVLNPNPYLFWITIGAPTIVKTVDISTLSAVLFIFFMYFCLVGSKVVVAILVGRSRRFLSSKNYIYLIRGLGIVLLIFAIIFFHDSFKSFGLLDN
jgi:threonine/homoserine/homoserine lactone efflux protein